jgi:hypothetical protein
MATILFSSITNASKVPFNPASDILSFDTPTFHAASLGLSYADDYTGISLTAGAITFELSTTVNLTSLTTGNVIFADGSRLIVGDDSSSGNDILANTLIGTAGHDQLLGLAHAGRGGRQRRPEWRHGRRPAQGRAGQRHLCRR